MINDSLAIDSLLGLHSMHLCFQIISTVLVKQQDRILLPFPIRIWKWKAPLRH